MEVLMLTGESQRGKTAVLHLVHEILIADGAKPSEVVRVGAKNQRDFTDVLTYHGKRIMILTMGDCKKDIQEALAVKDCDFLICACNDEHKEFYKEATYPFNKRIADELLYRLAANLYDANRIIEQLGKII